MISTEAVEEVQRAAVVETARGWLGTPYHHAAALKKIGCDCAMFPLAVYRELDLIPVVEIPYYPPDWHLHRSEEVYLKVVEGCGAREIFIDPRPGDFAMYRFGRTWSHGAIVIAWPLVIHSVIGHGVILSDGVREGLIVGYPRRYFTIW